jgi:hypothetical protein
VQKQGGLTPLLERGESITRHHGTESVTTWADNALVTILHNVPEIVDEIKYTCRKKKTNGEGLWRSLLTQPDCFKFYNENMAG